jgi:ribonuclease BN (tRNA processing enzyme)
MEVTKEPMPKLLLMYPHDSYTIKRYLAYIEDVTERFHDLVDVRPLRVGDSVPLQGVRGLHLNVLKADHFVHRQTAFSYRIDREHYELKEEVRALPQQEINRRIAQEGRAALTNCVHKPLVFYSGDGRPVLDPKSRKVPLMIHEATFLESGHKPTHADLPAVVALFREMEAKQLILFHLSTRYHYKEFMQELDHLVPNPRERERITVVRPGSMYQRDIPVPGY